VGASDEGSGVIRPYTVGEVARLTGFSRQTVTRMFEREPGSSSSVLASRFTSEAIAASESRTTYTSVWLGP
jgi:hypothetical protein